MFSAFWTNWLGSPVFSTSIDWIADSTTVICSGDAITISVFVRSSTVSEIALLLDDERDEREELLPPLLPPRLLPPRLLPRLLPPRLLPRLLLLPPRPRLSMNARKRSAALPPELPPERLLERPLERLLPPLPAWLTF